MRTQARYQDGVAWIALNDNAGSDDGPDQIAGYISTLLLADLFELKPAKVARDIYTYRKGSGDG